MIDLSGFTRVSAGGRVKMPDTYIRAIDGLPRIHFSKELTKELEGYGWERANAYANDDFSQVVVARGDDSRVSRSADNGGKAVLRISGAKSLWEKKMRNVDRAIYSYRWEKTMDGATVLVLEMIGKKMSDAVVRRTVANA